MFSFKSERNKKKLNYCQRNHSHKHSTFLCSFLLGTDIFSAKEFSQFYEGTINLLSIHANDIMPFFILLQQLWMPQFLYIPML